MTRSVLLKQLSLLLLLFFSFSSLSNLPTPDHSESIDNTFGIIIVHCMSDPLQCAPECKRGPFLSTQATNRHRGGCEAWNAYVAAQALKRGYDEVSGEDEDPAITRRKKQKRKKLEQAVARAESLSLPRSSIIATHAKVFTLILYPTVMIQIFTS
ncbi:hypothetical protein F5876DRAFT_71239 [Lentinula aff. lateritia]|uniref:Uncharacterized protein n=1 Tax=Lentinula aff. lateritia TaxID=2804960 RepID=A0ACC1TG31_9AGAR|nr:hypothetical protein F5876DRAFT_71239 [Lentinula aff. lateritia]